MSTSLPDLINNIGWTLLHFTWQGLLIGCATALLLLVLRNAHPVLRYNVGCAALLACVLWPAVGLIERYDTGAATSVASFDAIRLGARSATEDISLISFLQSHIVTIVGFWALCALLMAARMALGLVWVQRNSSAAVADARWQQRADDMAARLGISRQVRVRVVQHLNSPVTAGWLRPVVLLPAALVSGMPTELLSALLAHELAHVRRFDYLVNLGQNVIEALLFYHPAVWWISAQVRHEREQIADDLAARHLAAPRQLAHALSELARLQSGPGHLAQAANGGDLVGRIRRLVRPDQQSLNWTAAVPVMALAVACLTMVMHSSSVQAAPATFKPARADFDSCAKPVWPAASLKAQHTGKVTLAFEIGVDGKVVDSKVKQSSGHPELDQAAREGISLCRFRPATRNGKPVKQWMDMQYVWTLE